MKKEILQKAKPILFNTDMVQAILDDRKTETRRKAEFLNGKNPNWTGYVCDGLMLYNGTNEPCIKLPRYKVGDYLYVRETWSEWTDGYVYKAWTSPFPQPGRCSDKMMKWHPSIHMPKEAARIFLRVTDVQVERLKNMTLDDFLTEGVVLRPEAFNDPENAYMQAKSLFVDLWDSTINTQQLTLYRWDANPWVWVIAFERCEKPEGWCV